MWPHNNPLRPSPPRFYRPGSDDFTLFLWEPSTQKQPLARMTGHMQLINQVGRGGGGSGRGGAERVMWGMRQAWALAQGKYEGVVEKAVGVRVSLAFTVFHAVGYPL